MARLLLKGAWIAAMTSTLAGCLDPQVVPTADVSAAPPVNYRATVSEFVRATFFDPYSLRDVAISQPFPIRHGLTGSETIWYVCLRANGKNRMGAYVGRKETPIAFKGNEIDRTRTDVVEGAMGGSTMCGPAKYEPFPELEMKA